MNTETDRDLTTEEQEELSGGLFFRDDLSGEFADIGVSAYCVCLIGRQYDR